MISITEDNKMLGYSLFQACPNISHFVTTRQGGCGEGAYGTFNCTSYSGDNPENVLRNQQILCGALSIHPKELVIPFQTHGTEIGIIDSCYLALSEEEKQAYLQGKDALVSDVPGYALCISTADCAPLLFYDKAKQVVAAAHAGWRGTVGRIADRTIEMMSRKFGSNPLDILVSIGPSISLESFEVGEEVWQSFSDAGFKMEKISKRNKDTGKWHIDLWEANRIQLLTKGIPAENIELSGICTYIYNDQFFSARRLGIKSGRILSGILLNS